MRRRLRRMAGLTQQLGQNGVGLRILRMRLEDCARRGERLVELTQGLKGSYLSVLSGDHAWGSRRRGAKGRSRLGAKTARLIETAKREVSPEEIRLQCDRVPIPGDRLSRYPSVSKVKPRDTCAIAKEGSRRMALVSGPTAWSGRPAAINAAPR
jgi:hypothetical protein